MMMKVLAAVALCAVSTQALAADWWLIDVTGTKPKRSVLLMDKESIQTGVGATLRIWTETYYEDHADGIEIGKYQYEFNCNERTVKQVSYILYRPSGDVHSSDTPAYYLQKARAIAPDTLGEEEVSFVCGAKTNAVQIGSVPDFASGSRGLLQLQDHPSK